MEVAEPKKKPETEVPYTKPVAQREAKLLNCCMCLIWQSLKLIQATFYHYCFKACLNHFCSKRSGRHGEPLLDLEKGPQFRCSTLSVDLKLSINGNHEDKATTEYIAVNAVGAGGTEMAKKAWRSKIKEKLKYHFQNHIEKWRNKDHPLFPWKATLHILLIILVTTQVIL